MSPLGSSGLPLGSDPLPGLLPESKGQAWPFKGPRFPPLGAEGSTEWDLCSSTLLAGFWHSPRPPGAFPLATSVCLCGVPDASLDALSPTHPSPSLGLPGSLGPVLALGLQLPSLGSGSGLSVSVCPSHTDPPSFISAFLSVSLSPSLSLLSSVPPTPPCFLWP